MWWNIYLVLPSSELWDWNQTFTVQDTLPYLEYGISLTRKNYKGEPVLQVTCGELACIPYDYLVAAASQSR